MDTENNKKKFSTQQRRFMQALEDREAIEDSMENVNETLDTLEGHRNTLLDILRIYNDRIPVDVSRYMSPYTIEPCETIKRSPLHVRGERYLLAIYHLGRLPTPGMKSFYSHKYIYPVNYMCKRAYYKHSTSLEDMSEITFYNCAIRNLCNKPVFEITEGTHLCIRGKVNEVFNAFKTLFPVNIDFATVQEFFGLNNSEVRRHLSEQEGFQILDMGCKGFR